MYYIPAQNPLQHSHLLDVNEINQLQSGERTAEAELSVVDLEVAIPRGGRCKQSTSPCHRDDKLDG